MVDQAGSCQQQAGQAAGGDHLRLPLQFLAHPRDEAFHQAQVAEVEPRLHTVHGVPADHRFRPRDLHPRKLGGALEQRLGGDPDPRADRAAEVLTSFGDGVEGRGRAKVHHDARAPVQLERRHGVHDPVRPNLARRLVEDRHPALQAGADHHRLHAEELPAHLLQRSLDGRDDSGQDHGVDGAKVQTGEVEEALDEDTVLVARSGAARGQPPVRLQLRAVEDTHHRVRVADVEG